MSARRKSGGRGSQLALNGKWLAQQTTGTQRYASEVTRRLVALWSDPVVLHVPADADLPEWLPEHVQVRRSRLRGTWFEQVALPWAARSQLLLSLGGPAPLLGRDQIVTMHDASVFRVPDTYSPSFRAWYSFMYKHLAKGAKAILTVSAFSAKELGQVLGVGADRFVVAGNGCEHVDDISPQRPELALDSPFVLCIGTLARHKNLVMPVKALAEAGYRTVVVGASAGSRVFEASEGLGAEGVTVAGRLSDAEIVWLYRHAACLMFPSIYEGFGLPVIEAQRLGCPVVASRRSAIPEVAGEGAILVDATDPHELVTAVGAVLGGAATEELVIRGRENAARHSWRRTAATVHAVVEAALRDDGPL